MYRENVLLHPITKCVELQGISFKPATFALRQQEGCEQSVMNSVYAHRNRRDAHKGGAGCSPIQEGRPE